ncbi:D-inositol-3-phosphate glycosyltransferase [uncultured archaeon]|nr:D-inositol-3-phosphate glycosyltransferase [uncultured archaeon]
MDDGKHRVLFYVKGVPHSFYREQFLVCPENTEYIPSTPLLEQGERTAVEFAKGNPIKEAAKNFGRAGMKLIGIPSVGTVSTDCELVHSAETLLSSNKPWVVDFEDASSLCWFDPGMLKGHSRWMIEKLIKDRKCMKMLPWTDAARRNIESHLNLSDYEDRIEVVYPAVRPKALPVRKKKETVDFLFVGKYFYSKGGMETVAAFDRLSKTHDVRLHMVTRVPPDVKKRFEGNKNMIFYNRISEAELNSLYATADVFMLPYHLDSLGYVIMEAMAQGLPCIISDNYAGKELVEDGVSGLLVKDRIENYRFDDNFRTVVPPISRDEDTLFFNQLQAPSEAYLSQVHAAMLRFAEDGSFRNQAARNSYALTTSGKFSPGAKKAALKRIYEECLKK